MPVVSPLTTVSPDSAPSSAQATGSSALGKDEFLKLLMAQLANQDPTAPADSQAFVAQLAQFANVEQLQGANSTLNGILLAQASGAQTQTAALVGKSVVYNSDALALQAGQPAAITATLPADAKTVTATIVDANGRTVRTMQLGAQPAGALAASWDGRDDGGSPLPPGAYHVRLSAADAAGNAIALSQQATGRVTGVAFAGGVPSLLVNGAKVQMSSVIEIDESH
jgi:flagellar basal-body rod modification protein FlgD